MRLRRYLVSYEFLGYFFTKKKFVQYSLEPLPEDAKVIYIINSEKIRVLEVVIESKEFEEVLEGAVIPAHDMPFTDEEGYHRHLVDKL